VDDEEVFYTEDTLRDDSGPLTEKDKEVIKILQSDDHEAIISIVNNYRKERAEEQQRDATKTQKPKENDNKQAVSSLIDQSIDRHAKRNQDEWDAFDRLDNEEVIIEDNKQILTEQEEARVKSRIDDEALAIKVVSIINERRACDAAMNIFQLMGGDEENVEKEEEVYTGEVYIHAGMNNDDSGSDSEDSS